MRTFAGGSACPCGLYRANYMVDYPSIKKHLDRYYKQISTRATQGQTPYNLRSCAYLDDFYSPKVIWKRIGSILRFSYDEKKMFGLDSTCFLTGRSEKFICCILNSPVGHVGAGPMPDAHAGHGALRTYSLMAVRIKKNVGTLLPKLHCYSQSLEYLQTSANK